MCINEIMVPSFAHDLMGTLRCQNCEESLEGASIIAAGVKLDADNTACFAVGLRCHRCEQVRNVTVTTRPILQEQWWHQIAEWYAQGQAEARHEGRRDPRGETGFW